jgi:hypothetical protein
VITNIHKEKNQRTYLNGIVHSHRKTKKFRRTVPKPHIIAAVKSIDDAPILTRAWQELEYRIDV